MIIRRITIVQSDLSVVLKYSMLRCDSSTYMKDRKHTHPTRHMNREKKDSPIRRGWSNTSDLDF